VFSPVSAYFRISIPPELNMQSFLGQFEKKSQNIFLIDADKNTSFTYTQAGSIINGLATDIKFPDKKLAFLFCENSFISLLSYLAILKSGNAVLLLNSKLNDDIKYGLIRTYSPELIFSESALIPPGYAHQGSNGISYYINENKNSFSIYPDLAVLLSTSGTTGSPKLVRLSYKNIIANACSIAEYLSLNSSERAVTSLPMSYSYGLSVINSHIIADGSLVLTEQSFIFRDFWNMFNRHQCTSFAGVPYSYQLLKKTRFEKIALPSLKTLTQAGGRLDIELTKYFHSLASSRGIKFYVMYGQTEATARISFVPPEMLPQKPGSIGIAIPGGELNICSDGQLIPEPGITGELVYKGPNVMMGYAECREDLSHGDELNGTLYTGDLGYKDADGFSYVTGRLKRFIKIFGLRINTDEVEKVLREKFHTEAACCGSDDKLCILITNLNSLPPEDIRKEVASWFGINPNVLFIQKAEKIPLTGSGKIDYKAITALF
jgi:acyl-CoA synthetase (AMP-forming)/AMP-acid ligase II